LLTAEAIGEETMSRTRLFEWRKRFGERREEVEDDQNPGHPSTPKTDENIEKVDKIVRYDRRLGI